MKIKLNSKGFTLVELLVVIAIISVLSSVVFASIASARAKGRDARRKADLNQVRIALNLYYDTYGNWIQLGSGCGCNGDGNGWFSLGNSGCYQTAISQCLLNAGLTSVEIIDPTGARSGSTPSNTTYTYMKYTCGNPSQTWLYARLETVSLGPGDQSDAVNGTCAASVDSSYGMNYVVRVNP